MTTYYKAIFADGRIETRSTQSRKYVACVDVSWQHPGWSGTSTIPPREPHTAGYVTWCGSPARAASEVAGNRGKGRTAESAEAVEITAAEYRRLKGAKP